MSDIRIRNWRIMFDGEFDGKANKAAIAGLLVYEGKIIPAWGCGMRFIADKYGVRYDTPEVVPEYVKNKLEALRERFVL